MKLNSVHSRGMAAPVAGISVLAIAAILLLSFAPFFSFAAGTTVTVQVTGTQPFPAPAAGGTKIPVNGSVTPAPGVAGYSVTLQVSNPSGLNYVQSAAVNGTTGKYSATIVTGTPAGLWGNGTYTLTVVYATSAQGQTSTASTTFTYGTFSTTTSTSGTVSTTGSGSHSGTTTTVVVTTIVTTIVTTVNQGGTTITSMITQGGTTVTSLINSGTTTTVNNGGNNGTALAIGAVGLVIAVIAGGLAAMALRKH